ncbi:unnamed protein product [Calicophoron daubneyi]|uniref:Uncharacterized protein n=1 Tax=Calicophoron daubneyi TaxID=300641 RepID=A0AAV2THJ9_CALDB
MSAALHTRLLQRITALCCLNYLLKTYGASSVDKNGQTALHHASALGLLASCKVITKNSNGSIVNAVDRYSRTALHLATMAGHGDIVQLLLDNRAKPEICDCQGFSAMHYARTKRLHFCMLVFAKYRRKMVHREVMNPTQTGLNWSQRGLHLIDNECLTARPRYPTDSDTSSSTNVFEEDCSVGKRPPTPEPQNSQLRNVNTNKDKNTAANTRSFNFDNVMSTKCTTYSSVKNLLENRKITNSNSKSESVAKEPKRECQKIKPLPNLKCKASDISSRTLGYKSQVNPAVTIVQAPDLSRNDNGQRSSVSDDDIRSLKEVKLLAPRPNYYLNFPSDNTKVPTRQTIRVNECQGKSSLNSDVSDVESSCRATVPKIIWARNPPCSAKISLSDRTQENTLTPKLRMEDGFPSRYGKLDYQMQGRTTPSRPSPGDSSVSDVELASVTIPTPPRTENNGCLEKHSKDLRTEVLGNLMQPSRKDANSSETPRLLKRSQIKWTMSSMKRLFSSERNTDGQNSVAKSPSRVSGIDCQQAQKEARKQNEPDDHQGNKQTDGKRQQSELMNKPLHRCEIGHFKHPILSPSFSWFTGKNPATQIIETKNSSCANVSENLPRKNMIRRH